MDGICRIRLENSLSVVGRNEAVGILIQAGILTGALTFVAAGLAHARRFSGLARDIAQQSLLPGRSNIWAAGVVISELVVGGSVASLLSPSIPALYGIFALIVLTAVSIYATVLFVRRPGIACGCDSSNVPASRWTSLRAWFFTLVVVASLAMREFAPASTGDTLTQLLLSLMIGTGLALSVWILPIAMVQAVNVER